MHSFFHASFAFLSVTLLACSSGTTSPSSKETDGGDVADDGGEAGTVPSTCPDAAALPQNPAGCPTFEDGCLNGAYTCTGELECIYERSKEKSPGCRVRMKLICDAASGAEGTRYELSCVEI